MDDRTRTMAKEAGFIFWDICDNHSSYDIDWSSDYTGCLEKFAQLVRADMRHRFLSVDSMTNKASNRHAVSGCCNRHIGKEPTKCLEISEQLTESRNI